MCAEAGPIQTPRTESGWLTIHAFDKSYWEDHWNDHLYAHRAAALPLPANPYLIAETGGLPPGTALDAGCGTGAEAMWLATRGWHVTGVDISARALSAGAGHATTASVSDRVEWVNADLATWEPDARWDLVATSYTHAAIPQLELYQRLASWVAPAGTLLIVGHLHHESDRALEAPHPLDAPHRASGDHPDEATVTVDDIATGLDSGHWHIEHAAEHTRDIRAGHGEPLILHDAVVRATRRR